ncbi:MAG: FkbM family methyltransferase [Pseudomonadota bacterium]|nr:FkbM family methyltransferase [Pseudomonadota bacterium]
MQPKVVMPIIVRAAFWWHRFGIRGKWRIPRAIGQIWQGENLFILTRHGGFLSVDASNLDVYAYIYNSGGQWDGNVMQTCERVLRSSDIYYDIGSNTGIFSIDAAIAIPGLTVYAFEPQPSLTNHIRRSIDANNLQRVKCLELMLGREDGETLLYLSRQAIRASMVPLERRFRELRRPMRTVDSLISSGEIEAPDVIKIDVEGAEMKVFEGARQTLRMNNPSIIFEADENMVRFGIEVQNVFDSLLQAAPYRIYSIDLEGNLLTAQPPYDSANYLALAPRHFDRI